MTAAEPDSTAAVEGFCDSLSFGDAGLLLLESQSGGWRVQPRFRFLMKGLGMKSGPGGRLALMMTYHKATRGQWASWVQCMDGYE